MPTFIKAGFWEKAKKGYAHWLNLDDLITSLIPPIPTPSTQIAKVQKTTITTAQVLQLNTTPITILNSDNPLTIKYPINIYIKRNVGTGYTLATNSFRVINDYGSTMSTTLNPAILNLGQEGYLQSAIYLSQNWSGGTKNSLYKLQANVGNPTGGTGDLDVYVTYVEITL